MAKDLHAQIAAAVNKVFKGGATLLGQGAISDVSEVIPTGIDVLDRYVLGIGGLAAGRTSELFSEEGVGKTSLLLQTIASCQRQKGIAILTETERALDSKRAEIYGIDLDRVILLQPDHIPEAGRQIELALEAIPPGGPSLTGLGPVFIGWDSVAATMSKQEAIEGLSDKESFDKRAKELSQMMRVIGPILPRARAHLMCINQVRANIGVLFGDKFTTPCGKALKFHASVRLQCFGGKAEKDAAGQHIGKTITVMAIKNKHCRPFRKARVRMMYDTGFNNGWSTLNHAKDLKLVGARCQDLAEARRALDAAEWYKTGSAEGARDPVADDDDFTSLPGTEAGLDPEGL